MLLLLSGCDVEAYYRWLVSGLMYMPLSVCVRDDIASVTMNQLADGDHDPTNRKDVGY